MFFKVAGFEFRYQLRQPIFWIAVFLFTLLAFGTVASSNIQIGSTDNIHKNAPFVIARSTLVFAEIYMFVVAAFVANVIVRDDETGFGGIVRSTRMRKVDYLYGRFLGAFGAAATGFLAVPLGLWLGASAPWVDHETLGPFVARDYLYAYVVLGLPVVFLTASIFFTLTTVSRSMMWTYVGVVALFIGSQVLSVVLGRPGLEHIAALWEPFGAGAFGLATRYWTASERNTLVPPIVGDLLWNKVIWMSAAVALLALAAALFRYQAGANSKRARKAATLAAAAPPEPTVAPGTSFSAAKPVFNAAATRAQLLARTRLDAGQVFRSPAYFVLLGLAAALSLANLWFATEISLYGGKVFPVSRIMMQALSGAFPFFSLIIAIYYAGELVWREKERKTQEIIDAAPVPDWMFVAPKTLAISLVLFSTFVVGILVAMAMQAVRGFFDFRVDEYLLWWLLPNTIDAVLIAALAIFVQTLSPNKFVGWAVMVIYLIATIVMNNLGFEDNLYQYGFGVPGVPLSDMNGQGHYWIGADCFRLYWSAFALVLLVLAYGLWRRGTESRLRPRLRALPRRLTGVAGLILGLSLAVFVATGVFIFYNAHVLNPYRTTLGDEKWTADYEKMFLRYETLPQPRVAHVSLDLQIWPHQTRIVAHGVYVIQNRTSAPIGVLHVRFVRDLIVNDLKIDGASLQKAYPDFNYRIYAFDKPMQPGESRNLSFVTTFRQQGFRNSGNTVRIMDNGTFVNDGELTPRLGMDRSLLLDDRAKRRKYGLPPELRMPVLGTPGADQFNDLRRDSDWVKADITVTTDADQVPIAPGYKVSDVVANGRRTVRFVTDSPVLNFFSAQSARYAVSTVNYKGIDISVYYDPQHPWNVARIQQAMKASLDYYQANFSPYQFHQVRVLEFPAPDGSFAQSFTNTIPWSESIFFIADNSDPSRVDMVTYVGAHELGHQWWAHQVIGAEEQGGAFLSETMAQYSAGMVMKHMYGRDMMRKFLKFELDSYLRNRGGSVLPEMPLDRVETQDYVYYRKGSLAMYRLQDQIGEDAVNRALRHLLHDFAFKGPPYPTSVDLIKDLRQEAPADKQQLITDLLQRITLYDVKSDHAVVKKRPDGRYDLTFTVDARKVYADGLGHETAAPMNEPLDVGAFDVDPADASFNPSKIVALQQVAIHSGVQTVTLTMARPPKFAGVDPFSELIDRDTAATITKVAGP